MFCSRSWGEARWTFTRCQGRLWCGRSSRPLTARRPGSSARAAPGLRRSFGPQIRDGSTVHTGRARAGGGLPALVLLGGRAPAPAGVQGGAVSPLAFLIAARLANCQGRAGAAERNTARPAGVRWCGTGFAAPAWPWLPPWRLLFSAAGLREGCDVLRSDRPAATPKPEAMARARVGLGVAPAGPRVGQGAFTQCVLLSGGGGPAKRCPHERHVGCQRFLLAHHVQHRPPGRWDPARRAFVFGGG